MRTLIILGGEEPSASLLENQLSWADQVVAADRGIEPLLKLGVEPDALVGDLDSVSIDVSSLNCCVQPLEHQHATDFEKALWHADHGEDIHVVGGMGGRHDHFLTNLLVAAGVEPKVFVVFLSDREVLHRVMPECPLIADFPVKSIVSLIPFARCENVVAQGFKWPLKGMLMGIDEQLGQSNIVMRPPVTVSVSSGVMYVALQTDNPGAS